MVTRAFEFGRNVGLAALLSGVAAGALAAPAPRSAPLSGAITAARGGEQAALVEAPAWRSAEVRQQLKAGDTLRTNGAGTLAIVFADRTQIRLGRNSVLVVRQVTAGVPSSLQLQQGSVWGRSPRGRTQLSVETPAATAAIRGTDWALTVSGAATSLQVFEGQVQLANDRGAVDVAAGQAARAETGQAPVRFVLADPVGREQMLYVVRAEAAGALLRGPGGAATPDAARAFQLAYEGDLRGALDLTTEALARTPGDPELLAVRSRTAILLGRTDLAKAAVAEAIARDPQDARALALRAEIEADADGLPYAAIRTAEAATRADPKLAAAWAVLGRARLERGADREALAAFDTALALEPSNPELHALRAQTLLTQNRVVAAKHAIDRALELDPSGAVSRAARAQYLVQTGQIAAARDEAVAATTDNPGYGRALTQLAELDFRLGERGVAIQQLDAADRLDPESALTPAARAAVALHTYDLDGAIGGAMEALRRHQARGGIYSSLSENRTTGSYAAQAFRFGGMDDWARYYGDRVFDPYAPSGWFDQSLSRLPDPTTVAPVEGLGFDTTLGRAFGPLSGFLHGLALDPLAVTYPKARLQFFREAFAERSLGASIARNGDLVRPTILATLDGLSHAPFASAYSLTLGHREANRRAGAPGARGENAEFLRGWIGAEPGAYDNLAAFVDLEDLDEAWRNAATGAPMRSSGHDRVGFGLWNHAFADRNVVTLGFGLRDRAWTRTSGLDSVRRDTSFQSIYAGWQRSAGALDVALGGEAVRQQLDGRSLRLGRVLDSGRGRFSQSRAYVDARWAPDARWLVQAQAALVDSNDRRSGTSLYRVADLTDPERTRADVRLGVAVAPTARHWLRAAVMRETSSEVPFTLAPTHVVGLRPDLSPQTFAGASETAMARWDGEWSPRVFTSVEYEHQTSDGLLLATADEAAPAGFDDLRLDRVRAAVNIWPGGGLGLAASYAWTDSEAVRVLGGVRLPEGPLPHLPRRLVQAQVTYAATARVRMELRQTFASAVTDFAGMRRRAGAVTDASLIWEPLDKQAEVRLVIENLFDTARTIRVTPGRSVGAALALRF